MRSLGGAFPAGNFLYLEGIPDPVFERWLVDHAVTAPLSIDKAILWPRPQCYHIALTPVLLAEAAELIERERIPIPSYHLHVHDGHQLLLRWYDAFVTTDGLFPDTNQPGQAGLVRSTLHWRQTTDFGCTNDGRREARGVSMDG